MGVEAMNRAERRQQAREQRRKARACATALRAAGVHGAQSVTDGAGAIKFSGPAGMRQDPDFQRITAAHGIVFDEPEAA